MSYIAVLRRFVNFDSSFGTFGSLNVYRESDERNGSAYPVVSFTTLEPRVPVVPLGEHNLSLTYSSRFSSKLPYRKYRGVPLISSPSCPERRGIRIHIGNTLRDTRGCILIGTDFSQDGILNSRAAYIEFMKFASRINKIIFYGSY